MGCSRAPGGAVGHTGSPRPLYGTLGFCKPGRRRCYYRSGEDALIQWLSLKPGIEQQGLARAHYWKCRDIRQNWIALKGSDCRPSMCGDRKIWKGQAMKINHRGALFWQWTFGDSCRESPGTPLDPESY